MTAVSIAHLRLKLDDVEPAVVRRLEVPVTIRLDRLHLVLQAAMAWTNSHLYEIRARDVAGACPILTSATDRLMPARPGLPTSWKMSGSSRSDISTTSATAGNTPSASSA